MLKYLLLFNLLSFAGLVYADIPGNGPRINYSCDADTVGEACQTPKRERGICSAADASEKYTCVPEIIASSNAIESNDRVIDVRGGGYNAVGSPSVLFSIMSLLSGLFLVAWHKR